MTNHTPLKKMVARDPEESHRASTPLELLFDLCFVVAIAQAGTCLHHGLAHGHFGHAIGSYLLAFFAIWWLWMNFTWYASAYDVDDALYRVKVFVQMLGALTIAAGIPRAFENNEWWIITIGYAIARVGMIALWVRTAVADPVRRETSQRFIVGLAVVQIAWIAAAALPRERWIFAWLVLAPIEMLIPLWAEKKAATPWHPHHIGERYGLLTLIVLGESVLAATLAIQSAIDDSHASAALLSVIGGSMLMLFAMWWLYFDREPHWPKRSGPRAFLWGYGHYFVFASAAAVGAGLAVAVDYSVHEAHISTAQAGAAVAVPVALYLFMCWLVRLKPLKLGASVDIACWVALALILASSFSTWSVLLSGVVLCALCGLVTRAQAHTH